MDRGQLFHLYYDYHTSRHVSYVNCFWLLTHGVAFYYAALDMQYTASLQT